MNMHDDELRTMLLHGAAGFLGSRHSLQRAREFRLADTGFDPSMWRAMAECGWLGMTLPEDQGGTGLGSESAAELAQLFGAALVPEPFALGGVAPSTIIAMATASPLRIQLAKELASGTRLLAPAWQQKPGELVPGEQSAILRKGDAGWLLDGRCVFTEAHADTWLVAARVGGEPCVVAMHVGTAGLSIDRQRMADGTSTATLCMDGVRLAADAMLLRGDVAQAAIAQALDDARLVTAAQLAGVAQGALALAIAYIGQRTQFGSSIGSFQAVRHRVVELDIQRRLANASWRKAARTEGAARGATISAAKARCGDAALLITRACVQLHGAIGYTREADPGLFLDSAMRLASSLGNAQLHRSRFVREFMARPAVREDAFGSDLSEPRPDFNEMSDKAFAAWLREWLHLHCPPKLRQPVVLRLRGEEERMWLRTLLAHGLRCPAIPREHGGMGLSLSKQFIYKEVFDSFGVARVLDMGATLLAPILIQYGTPEQKAEYLPRILACEDTWCQGYSEPGSGSDLASLRMSAVRDGDDFVINGQKIWTTHANTATRIFMLARTDSTAKKQAGISFLLADLDIPGITIRPIVNLAGEDEFCEVFFDNVRVPVANLVGNLNEGWTVAKSLLGVERLWTGSPSLARQTFNYVLQLLETPDVRATMLADDRFQRTVCDLHDTEAVYAEVCADAVSGRALDAEYSVIKILSSELFQRMADLAMEWANERGGALGECSFSDRRFNLYGLNMVARPATIYGGTAEVQRDILARVILGVAAGKR
jgi:alkylation response protein AidB-like acyl-CoA dehydrogenase